jgi:hypothetical protein
MRRSRRQRQRQARTRWVLVILLLAIVALVGGWLYARSKRAEPATATGIAPAATAVITIPVPGSAPAETAPPPAPTTVQPAPVVTSVPMSVESDAEREASWVASRKEAIRIQSDLRAAQVKAKAEKASTTSDVRCVDGQQMKRVENGWVQDGAC